MSIAVCGVARSGSTLVWQILSAMLGFPVGQLHPATDADLQAWSRYVVTIRHPFDIAASRYRVRLSRDERGAGWTGLEAELFVMLEHFRGAQKILSTMDSMLLRYEEFYLDYDLAIDALEKFCLVEVSAEKRAAIKEEFSLMANQQRAQKLGCFLDHDPISRVHGDHIGAVHPGMWKEQLPDWGVQLVIAMCSNLAKEWGYETD